MTQLIYDTELIITPRHQEGSFKVKGMIPLSIEDERWNPRLRIELMKLAAEGILAIAEDQESKINNKENA